MTLFHSERFPFLSDDENYRTRSHDPTIFIVIVSLGIHTKLFIVAFKICIREKRTAFR